MDIQTTKVSGRYFSVVRDGATVAHITGKYFTRCMAEAAAKCWIAFHKGENMDKVTVDPNEVYTVNRAGDQRPSVVPAERVQRAVDEGYALNLDVEVKTGGYGQRYIQVSKNGCAYSQFHIGAAYRDRVMH